jgi:anti-anti-sigma factor
LLHEPLEVRVERQGDTTIVRISGACDASCHEQLRDRLLEAEAYGAERVVVDMTALRFIDSLGLRVVIGAWNRARQAGHLFSIARAQSGQVRGVFEATGVDQVGPVAASRPV